MKAIYGVSGDLGRGVPLFNSAVKGGCKETQMQ